jgi:hypothetical protein
MRIKNNPIGCPLKILAIGLSFIGLLSLILTHHYWTICLIVIGLLPFLTIHSLELSKDKKSLNFYNTYGLVYKLLYRKIHIPADFDTIYYQKRNYSIRTVTPRYGNLAYETRTDYRIIFANTSNPTILNFIDDNEGYKVAKYLSNSFSCKLIEKEITDNTIKKEDNEYYINFKRDATSDFRMIRSLKCK